MDRLHTRDARLNDYSPWKYCGMSGFRSAAGNVRHYYCKWVWTWYVLISRYPYARSMVANIVIPILNVQKVWHIVTILSSVVVQWS